MTMPIRESGEFAALTTAHLYRPGEIVTAFEAEAHDDMGHVRSGQIGHKEVEGLELGEVVAARYAALGEIIGSASASI
jgi:hypothetical protein